MKDINTYITEHRNSYYLMYNGKHKSDKEIAEIINTNIKYKSSAASEKVEEQVKWIIDNCENLNDLAIENALEHLWYFIIEIFNNNISDKIREVVNKYVEEGKIKVW